jgi:hypothetical protein
MKHVAVTRYTKSLNRPRAEQLARMIEQAHRLMVKQGRFRAMARHFTLLAALEKEGI